MTDEGVLQIRIDLMGTDPGIWRRIQIPVECTFWDLHVAIQDAMGWTDSHLHAFRVADPVTGQLREIGLPIEDDLDDGVDIEPGWECGVAALLSIRQPRAMYEYDFGDSWEHAVVLEDVLPIDDRVSYPRCVAGARACPPEDVGGVPGYEGFLEAIADPQHEQHEEYLVWVGGAFDPERFDPGSVRFQDPGARWQEVFGEEEGAMGPPVTGLPQLEGGFTGPEIQRLLLAPFADDSPLQLETGLADEVFEDAPLVRDCRSFLRLLAEETPLKLTKKGNLPRATLIRLIETGALGHPGWWESKNQLNEADAPRATLLRMLAELTGLTRKRHGQLDLTKRGRGVVDGRESAGDLYRSLMDRYATRYNWAYTDGLPESRWLQSCFWYALYLLQEYGEQKRPSTFYAERFLQAFPFALQDFSDTLYSSAEDGLTRAFEWRVLTGFALEFGLALYSSSPDDRHHGPSEVWAGPLLRPVVQWRRGDTAGVPADGTTTTVVAGPWSQAAEGAEIPEDVADPTIDETLAAFLTAQRRRLRSPRTLRKYEQVVALLQSHLDGDGHEMLAAAERDVWARYSKDGPAQRTFCEVFGPERIPPSLSGFLGFFLVRNVSASAQLMKAAGTVCKKLMAWLEEEGLLDDDGMDGLAMEDPAASGREVAQAREAADLLGEAAMRFQDLVPELPDEDYVEFDHHTIKKVTKGRLWLEVYDDDARLVEMGPFTIPEAASQRLRAGWDISCGLGRIDGQWQLVEVANVYPVV